MYAFSATSMQRLRTCHADLILLATEALADPECPFDMTVFEGHRTRERQDQLYDEGYSKVQWPNSRHNQFPALAVDIVAYVGGPSWDWQYLDPMAVHIKATWDRLTKDERTSGNYTLTWGGDWAWRDGAHWQLDRVGT